MSRTTIIGLTILALMLIFGLIQPHYLSGRSLATMLRLIAYPGIAAVGVAMCLIGGTMDLSVGAVAGLSSILAARLMFKGYPIAFSIAAAITASALVGYINTLLIVKLRLTTFIATIGTMFAVRGVVHWISKGYYVYPLPGAISAFGALRPLGLSWAFIAFVALLITFQWLLDKTVWGLTVRATGSDREVAFCTEVNVDRVQTQLHVISSILAGIAGLFLLCRIGGGQPSLGEGIELTVIAGCAIGGVSLFGYEGSMTAVFLGLLFLQAVLTGVITSGTDVYLQPTVKGAIMLAAMTLDAQHSNQIFFRRTV